MIILFICFYLLLYIIIKMAKVAMMESGLRRKQTYEEIIDYIENDPDKIQYPNRAAKFLRKHISVKPIRWNGSSTIRTTRN